MLQRTFKMDLINGMEQIINISMEVEKEIILYGIAKFMTMENGRFKKCYYQTYLTS